MSRVRSDRSGDGGAGGVAGEGAPGAATGPAGDEPDPRRARLLSDVRAALAAPRPGLPCKYLYDDRGCALFEEITRLPEYYPTRTEEALLAERAGEILARARPRDLVELGSGVGRKSEVLLEAFEGTPAGRRLVLFDINAAVLAASARRLTARHPGLEVRTVTGEFPEDLPRLGPGGGRLMLLLGGTIGNVPPPGVPEFLSRVAAQLIPGDGFLLGLDLIKDVERLTAAYNDRAGVTARFNLNLLAVMNRELGADFDLDAFEHVALWEPGPAWMRLFVRARRSQFVRLPALGLTLTLAAGDELQTEVSSKYTQASLIERLAGTDLVLDAWHTDADGDFALALLRKVAPSGRRDGRRLP